MRNSSKSNGTFETEKQMRVLRAGGSMAHKSIGSPVYAVYLPMDSFLARRYSLGDNPVYFLNSFEKWT